MARNWGFQRKEANRTWSGDLASGTSGSLTGEQMNIGRLTPGATYRIGAYLWAGAPATSVALKATFFNSAGVRVHNCSGHIRLR